MKLNLKQKLSFSGITVIVTGITWFINTHMFSSSGISQNVLAQINNHNSTDLTQYHMSYEPIIIGIVFIVVNSYIWTRKKRQSLSKDNTVLDIDFFKHNHLTQEKEIDIS